MYNRTVNISSQDRAIGLAIQLFDARFDPNLETIVAETNEITISTALYRFDFPSINTNSLNYSISNSTALIIDESSSEKEVVAITSITNNNPVVINNNVGMTGDLNVEGYITIPNLIHFKIGIEGSETIVINTDNEILPYDRVIDNVGNHYNTSTYKFTTPVSGTYFFYFTIMLRSDTNGTASIFQKRGEVETIQNEVFRGYGITGSTSLASLNNMYGGITLPCIAGDEVYVLFNTFGSVSLQNDNNRTLFGGYFIG